MIIKELFKSFKVFTAIRIAFTLGKRTRIWLRHSAFKKLLEMKFYMKFLLWKETKMNQTGISKIISSDSHTFAFMYQIVHGLVLCKFDLWTTCHLLNACTIICKHFILRFHFKGRASFDYRNGKLFKRPSSTDIHIKLYSLLLIPS